MATDKIESLSETWAARFDDRDDEELAYALWARRIASRDQAMAQPFRNFPMADEMSAASDKPNPAKDSGRPG